MASSLRSCPLFARAACTLARVLAECAHPDFSIGSRDEAGLTDARISADWEERRKVFDRAREAEDQGRLSLALDLYKSLGRDIDVQRITVRMRGQYETN